MYYQVHVAVAGEPARLPPRQAGAAPKQRQKGSVLPAATSSGQRQFPVWSAAPWALTPWLPALALIAGAQWAGCRCAPLAQLLPMTSSHRRAPPGPDKLLALLWCYFWGVTLPE
jgi:hypothetical protein